jgi:hypothetical protein
MNFSELLLTAIRRSEIPLRFEPGAEESVARPVTELLRVWVQAHEPAALTSEFARGRQDLIDELLAELDGSRALPG